MCVCPAATSRATVSGEHHVLIPQPGVHIHPPLLDSCGGALGGTTNYSMSISSALISTTDLYH